MFRKGGQHQFSHSRGAEAKEQRKQACFAHPHKHTAPDLRVPYKHWLCLCIEDILSIVFTHSCIQTTELFESTCVELFRHSGSRCMCRHWEKWQICQKNVRIWAVLGKKNKICSLFWCIISIWVRDESGLWSARGPYSYPACAAPCHMDEQLALRSV